MFPSIDYIRLFCSGRMNVMNGTDPGHLRQRSEFGSRVGRNHHHKACPEAWPCRTTHFQASLFEPSARQSVIQGLQFSGHFLLLSAMCYGVGLAVASIRGRVSPCRLALPVWSRNPRIGEKCAQKALGGARGLRR